MKILPDTHRQLYCPKCRRLVIATVDDLLVGFTCIRCGAKIIQPEGYNDPVLYSDVEEELKERERLQAELDELAKKEAAEKALAEEQQEPKENGTVDKVAEENGEAKPEEGDEASENTESEEEEEKEPEKGFCFCPGCKFHNEIEHKNKTLVQCIACHKFFQKPHDPEHDPDKVILPSDKLPSEQHLLLLNELNFCGVPETARDATTILLVIRDCIENGIKGTYPSYRFLPPEMKRSIIVTYANSSYFAQMYFDHKTFTEKELDLIMVQAIPDSELLSSIKHFVKSTVFRDTVKYVNEFTQYNFGYQLDRDIPELLALKAFNRGFGKSLKTYESVTYHDSGKKKKAPENPIIEEKRRIEFYNRNTPVHIQLEHLLNESGFMSKREKKNENAGCLFFVLLFICFSSVFFTINYISHC